MSLKPLRPRIYPLALAVLILLMTLLHLYWIRQDERYQPFIDPYPQRTLVIADHLRANGLTGLPQLIWEARIGPRPPLYQFGAALFVLVFGRSVDAMLGLNLAMNGLLMVGAYLAGKLVRSKQAGLLAALLVATLPPLVQLTRIFRPHSVLPAVVMLWLWLLLCLLKNRTIKNAWLFCLTLPLAFWLHPNAFYLLVPGTVLVAGYLAFFSGRVGDVPTKVRLGNVRRPFISKGLVPGLLVAVGLTAVWYLPAMSSMVNLVARSAALWSTERYGFGHIPASFWWYAWTFPGAIGILFTAVFGAAVVVYLLVRRPYPLLLSLLFLLMYLGLGLRQGTLAWMNFAAVLPLVGVLTTVFLTDLTAVGETGIWRTLGKKDAQQVPVIASRLLLAAAVFVALFNVYFVTLPQSPRSRLLAQTLGAPLDEACGWRMIAVFCPNAPQRLDFQETAILQAILADGACGQSVCRVAVVTENAESFSSASLDYFRAQDFPQANMEIVPIRLPGRYSIDWLRTEYLVYVPQMQNNNYANSVLAFLERPSATFTAVYDEVAQIPQSRGWQARILKRTRPLTDAEVDQLVTDLALPDALRASLNLDLTFIK